jgi:ferredoxin-NADP reductase
MLTWIDNFLNRITMYRLVLYYLLVLLAAGAVCSAFGLLPFTPLALIVSTAIILAVCWAVNKTLAALLRVPTNVESIYITASILALIISPISLRPFDLATFASGAWFLVAASTFAMASKYILAIKKKHIFNPAAIAVVLTAFFLGQYASWWVGGNLPLLAFVVIGGLLVVRKIKRFDLVISFGSAALASIVLTNLAFNPFITAEKALIHTSIFFFAFVMLTEPLTTPPTRALRIAYGAIVGALFSPAIHIGSIYSTPELALVVGNLFSYIVSPKGKHLLTLKSKEEVGTDTYDFSFAINSKQLRFKPGQYMEWTLAHSPSDSRGNRRYFTIASSPTESDLHLGIKFYPDASSFKQKMLSIRIGEKIMGGALAGDFTLPRDIGQKLVFIAGGVGITPFRSMVKYLSDLDEHRDIVLLYSNRTAGEISYTNVFDEAATQIGLKTIYAITDEDANTTRANGSINKNSHSANLHYGRIDAELIRREIPDYRERMFYISGPRAMVTAFEKTLSELGVPLTHIKTDFFPGFA